MFAGQISAHSKRYTDRTRLEQLLASRSDPMEGFCVCVVHVKIRNYYSMYSTHGIQKNWLVAKNRWAFSAHNKL